jgi:hypothetical protein
MILHEGSPSLTRRGRFPYFRQIFLDRPFTHRDSQLQQFTAHPLRPPQVILSFAIFRMSAIVSGEIFGLFCLLFDFRRQ